jgi:hypothetical protein
MLAAEWRAMALQMLLGLEQSQLVMAKDPPTQHDIDQAREWVVTGAGDLMTWQSAARRISKRYTDGASLLLPRQEKGLDELVEQAGWVLAHLNDHLEWLASLRDSKDKKMKIATELDCKPVDEDALKATVEREAAVKAEQIVS